MKKNSFIEGTVIATVAIVLTKIMGVIYVIPFYYVIGSLGSALYAYAYNIYVIFLEISTAGIPIAISKLVSEYNTLGMLDAKTRSFYIGRKLISIISTIAFIILFVFAKPVATLIIGNLKGGNTVGDVTFVIRAISFAVLVIPYLSVAKGYLQGHNFISPSSKSQVFEQLVRIIVILLGSTLALKVFHLPLRTGVGIAVFGATAGGLVALLYIHRTINKNKIALSLDTKQKSDDVTNKEIRNKIIKYAIPLIVISVATSIYNFTDLVLILRTLKYLAFPTSQVEYIATSLTTWAPKIHTIIESLAMGMSISIIPTIGAMYAQKNWSEINSKFNKALQIILVISLPMTIGIALLAKPVWNIFYSANPLGSSILAFSVFKVLFINICIVVTTTMQSLSRFKTIYKSTITGFVINALLDVPMMLLFYKLSLPVYYGAIVATIIGYIGAIMIVLRDLQHVHKMDYSNTAVLFKKILVPTLTMIVVMVGLKTLFPFQALGRLSALIYGSIFSLVGGLVYLGIAYKMKILQDIFGGKLINKIIKKLTFGKISN